MGFRRRFLLAVIALVSLSAGSGRAQDFQPAPRFTKDNELIRPTGYREWIFAGASLGMSYDKGGEKRKHPKFHNIYIQRTAYREYKETGRFPEGTILVMEIFTPGSQESINRQGHFEDQFAGVEAAVKDSARFPERWAYFSFDLPNGQLADTASAFPKDRCWSCHDAHGATDNVFTQFYPVLRRSE